MAILQSTTIGGTGYLQLPVGRTADRPAEPTWTVVSLTSTGSGNWTVPAGVTQVDVLVVGGGGGGGAWVPGGGGAGGVVYREGYPVTPGSTIAYTVGVGGTGSYNPGGYSGMPNASNGGQSVFGAITALGGGHGGSWTSYPASSGGSGGGNGSGTNGGAGTAGQGFAGGRGAETSDNGYLTGGGGGAGGPGELWKVAGSGELTTGAWGTLGKSGDGGPGLAFNITGTLTYYGGGGGGGYHGNTTAVNGRPGFGGIGGGGDGDGPNVDSGNVNPNNTSWLRGGSTYPTGQNGVANTGGGGGGGGSRGDANSRGGNGGSGVVIIRYTANDNVNLRQGAIRLNTQKGLEYYRGEGRWLNLSMPFPYRTNITTAYMAGGYKDAVAWNNVNRIFQSTDTCINLGDGAIARSFNYQSGACGLNIGYVFGSGNGHAIASNYVQGFNMRTEVAYNPPITAMNNNRSNSGSLFQEHYFAWITGGGASEIEEYNLTNEVKQASPTGGFSTTNQWGMSHETYGTFYWEEDSRNFHFASRTVTSQFGGQPSAYHQQKSVQSKYTNNYAGNEGSYNGGYNLRRTNMYTRTSSGTVAKPRTNCGEENFTMGQDWQYMIANYDGSGQNNGSWKFYYSTESGFNGGASMEPKGKAGASSGVCFWRS